jgi:hypothetical protein
VGDSGCGWVMGRRLRLLTSIGAAAASPTNNSVNFMVFRCEALWIGLKVVVFVRRGWIIVVKRGKRAWMTDFIFEGTVVASPTC